MLPDEGAPGSRDVDGSWRVQSFARYLRELSAIALRQSSPELELLTASQKTVLMGHLTNVLGLVGPREPEFLMLFGLSYAAGDPRSRARANQPAEWSRELEAEFAALNFKVVLDTAGPIAALLEDGLASRRDVSQAAPRRSSAITVRISDSRRI